MIWSWVKHAEFGYGQTIGDPAGDVVTVAFTKLTGTQGIPVSELTFLPIVEVALLKKNGVLPNGKSSWNGNCAPRQLGLRQSNWKHNQQTGVRGGVHLKTKLTPGGWPVFGKQRGGRQRFVEDWNADTSLNHEHHNEVSGDKLRGLEAIESKPDNHLVDKLKDSINGIDAEDLVDMLPANEEERAAAVQDKRDEIMEKLDESIEPVEQREPVRENDDDVAAIQAHWGIPTNGNGGVYSAIMRGISSKSPLRLKLKAYMLHEMRGVPVDDVADMLKVRRATVREWHRSGWFIKAEREVLQKIGSNGRQKKPSKS